MSENLGNFGDSLENVANIQLAAALQIQNSFETLDSSFNTLREVILEIVDSFDVLLSTMADFTTAIGKALETEFASKGTKPTNLSKIGGIIDEAANMISIGADTLTNRAQAIRQDPLEKKEKKAQKNMIAGLGKMSAKMAIMSAIMEPLNAFFSSMLEPLAAITPIFEIFGTKLSTLLIPLLPPLIEALIKLMPLFDNIVLSLTPLFTMFIGVIGTSSNIFQAMMPILNLLVGYFGVLVGVVSLVIAALNSIISNVATWISNITGLVSPLTGVFTDWSAGLTDGVGFLNNWGDAVKTNKETIEAENAARVDALAARHALTEAENEAALSAYERTAATGLTTAGGSRALEV